MRELIFQSEWRNSWLHHYPDCHYVKIPDAIKTPQTRFTPIKPYDCYVVKDKMFIGMELKWQKTVGNFAFKKVTPAQIQALIEVRQNGSPAYVVINYRVPSVSDQAVKRYGLQLGRLNIVFAIDALLFDKLDKTTDGASISFDYLLQNNQIIKMFWKDGFWNIPRLYKLGYYKFINGG